MAYNNNDRNELDYVFKKDAVGVTKTDDMSKSRILPLNERSFTTSLTFSDNIWSESHGLYAGAAAAVLTPSIYNKPNNIATDASMTKLTSLWGVGSATPANPLLAGQTWVSGLTNWIPSIFDQSKGSYDLMIYAVPQGTAPSAVLSTGAIVSPLGSNFVFDYATGILTFIGAPGLVGPNSWNILQTTTVGGIVVTSYDLYITSGYRYTGGTLTNFSAAGGSGSGGNINIFNQDDLDIIRNIGRRAWIEGATGVLTYDQATNTVDHNMTFFGNGSHYTIVCHYGDATNPDLVGLTTPDATFEWSGRNGPVSTPPINGIWNNNLDTANGYPHDTGSVGTVTLVTPPTQDKIVQLPITINTRVAGGRGSVAPYYGESFFYLGLPLHLLPADAMGPPVFTAFLQWPAPVQTTGSTLVIDGVQYFTSGAQVSVQQRTSGASYGYQVQNMYNVIKPTSFDKTTFHYIDFTTGDNDTINELFDSTKNALFDTSISKIIDLYENSQIVTLNVNATTIGAVLTNLKSVRNPSSGTTKVYPLPNLGSHKITDSRGYTYGGTQPYIGYLASVPETAGIKVGKTIDGSCYTVYKSFMAVRMSNVDVDTPQTPALVNIRDYDVTAAPSPNDPVYMPFEVPGALCAGDLINPPVAGNLKYDYILPTPQTFPTLGGVKYLVVKVGIGAPFSNFNIILAPDSTPDSFVGMTTVHIYWDNPTNPPANRKWYDAQLPTDNPGGCFQGFLGSKNAFQVCYNKNDYGAYAGAFTPGQGTMYICIGYTGIIYLNQIQIGSDQ
jgi:hypothetical protein